MLHHTVATVRSLSNLARNLLGVLSILVTSVATPGCTLPGTGDDSPFNDVMAIDTRPYAQSADVSGLPAGDHKLSFVVYVQKGRKWNETYAQRLRDAVRVRKLRPFLGDVKPQVEIEAVEAKSDRAQVTITLPMGEDETWAMFLHGSDVVPAEPGRREAFDFDKPETLLSFEQLVTSRFLRTTGYCPHPVEAIQHMKPDGQLVAFEVRLSEPLRAPLKEAVQAHDVDGPQLGTVTVSTAEDGSSFQIGPPEKLPAISGIMTVTLPAEEGLAGSFFEEFRCTPAAYRISASVGGYPGGIPAADGQRFDLSPTHGTIEFFGVPK